MAAVDSTAPVNPYIARDYLISFPFERYFSHEQTASFLQSYWPYKYWICGIYLVVIFGGKWLMKDRARFVIKTGMIMWSVFLATFSILGAARMVPELIHVLSTYGLHHSVCVTSFMLSDRIANLWSFLFVFSKLPELGDTIFIVLRKQPLIFLHWYHHLTVLLYSWLSYITYTSTGRWFITINYCIHAIMYSYYALRAMEYRPPKWIAMVITSLQILQMVAGTVINVVTLQYLNEGVPCSITYTNILLSLIMYLSYFGLFLRFFINAYFGSSPKTEKKVK